MKTKQKFKSILKNKFLKKNEFYLISFQGFRNNLMKQIIKIELKILKYPQKKIVKTTVSVQFYL